MRVQTTGREAGLERPMIAADDLQHRLRDAGDGLDAAGEDEGDHGPDRDLGTLAEEAQQGAGARRQHERQRQRDRQQQADGIGIDVAHLQPHRRDRVRL